MKRQKSCGPRLGKWVHQLPGVVTFAYDLRFRRVIARWKGIVEEIHFGGSIMPLAIIENLDLKKTSFMPSKWSRKWKPAENSKLPKWPKKIFWGIWKRWVDPDIHLDQSSLLRKQWSPLRWVPREEGKSFLNMNLGELCDLLKKLGCLVCGRLSQTYCWRGWIYSTNLFSLSLMRH